MEKADRDDWWPRWVWVGECFFWYWLTRVVLDKVRRAIKRLCVFVCVVSSTENWQLVTAKRRRCQMFLRILQLSNTILSCIGSVHVSELISSHLISSHLISPNFIWTEKQWVHSDATQFALSANDHTRQHDLLHSDWSQPWQTGLLHAHSLPCHSIRMNRDQ